MKDILTFNELDDSLIHGLTKIAAIVKRTLGPGGLPIIIERQGTALNGDPLSPLITKDGVTVATECFVADPAQNLIMQAVKDICKKTNKVAGDGTTTAIVLGEALVKAAHQEMKSSPNLNPQLVREELDAAFLLVVDMLREEARPIKDDLKQIEEVATISANGDRRIGQVLREAFMSVGAEGSITVDEGVSHDTTLDIVEGFQIDRGAEAKGGQFFNNTEQTKFDAKDVKVILFDGPLNSFNEVVPICTLIQQEAKANGKPFPPTVFVANSFSQEVIQFLLIQKAEIGLPFCAVRSPHMSHVRTAMLDDMAVLLGGTRLGGGSKAIQAATLDDVGECERIVITKDYSTFYGGAGAEEEVISRVDSLKAQKAEAETPYDASIFENRIASLTGGVAKIGVGGTTELEVKERYHRIEDALNASRAAVEEGVIPGGGVTLYKLSLRLKREGVNTLGTKILRAALQAPIRQIMTNVGVDPAQILTTKFDTMVLSEKPVTYNAREKEVCDAFITGILDPVKVSRVALENAISIAGLLITCGGGIVFTRSK